MERIKAINRGRIGELAKELDLPEWLVEAAIVEYLPCRRFFEEEAKVLFDFGMIDADAIRQLPRPVTVLSNVNLIHNVSKSVVAGRMMGGLVGLPMASMGDERLVLPEGRVNPIHVPWIQNNVDIFDWKHNLNDLAVVHDDDGFYQWRVAKFVDQPGPEAKHGWYESTVYSSDQLNALLRVHDEIIYGAFPGDYPAEGPPRVETRARLAELYSQLEAVRSDMRAAVVAFHAARKGAPGAAYGYNEEEPLTLTVFDQIALRDNKLSVRSFVEPLFFRAAYRAMRRSRQAHHDSISHGGTATHLEEEIEESAACITLCAMCLEAYINGFIGEKLPDLFKDLERGEVKMKWLVVPNLLGKPDCFDRGGSPFQNFGSLVNWRNDLVHYKHEYSKPAEIRGIGRGSKIHGICNTGNAQIAVETVRSMIRRLNESLGESVPSWVDDDRGWLNSP